MEKKQNRSTIIFVTIICALAAVIVILVLPRFLSEPAGEVQESYSGKMTYESTIITDDPETLQSAVDAMYEKAAEGQMALEMKTEAVSYDGRTFSCYLANSISNSYDMFMVFYRDDTQEEIYRTGLLPIGSRIETFTLDKKLQSGNYDITIVYNQVEEDLETIHAQVNVGLTLIVK